MTSLADVAARLRHVAEQLPIPQIGEASDHAEAAAAILAETFAGTSQPEFAEATNTFSCAHREAQNLLQQFMALRDRILTLADRLAGEAAPVSPPSPLPPSDRIDQIRRSLPAGVEKAQTQGRWLGPGHDVTVVRSGDGDEWFDKAEAFARTMPPHRRRAIRLARHVEVKLAMRMREEGRRHETVVIDRKVCGRRPYDRTAPLTCDKMLKFFLPPGATLTIVEDDGTRVTYEGERGR